MARTYKAKCRECGKTLIDKGGGEFPIYVVSTDEYFCNQICLSKYRKKKNS